MKRSLRWHLLHAARSRGHMALLGPEISTLDNWLGDHIPVTGEIPGRARRELMLVEALQQHPEVFGRIDPWTVASDLIALGALKALGELGRKVPDDVALVGFDDIPVAAFTQPPLTTVRQDTRLAAETLTDNLLRMIAGEEVTSPLVPISLVVRGSCGGRENTA